MNRPPPKAGNSEESEEPINQTRYPSPPQHVTNASRGIHAPSFSSFQPRELRFTSAHPSPHVAWSCDGRRLASVGIDKAVRIWSPEKSLDPRSATQYVGGHDFDVDYVAWNPTHPELFCTSSQRDKKIVFWDARQSRCVQTYVHSIAPSRLNYSPDGKTIVFTAVTPQFGFLTLNQGKGETKPSWSYSKHENRSLSATCAIFNNIGDGLVMCHSRQNSITVVDYPSLNVRENFSAHVWGTQDIAIDPRGRYLVSGGGDSLVDIFDMNDWICVNTITACEHPINALSFSHDGEYLAIASQGPYINICAVETGLPLHRVPTHGPVPTVTWHPSKYILAYCGEKPSITPNTTSTAYISLFGPGM
ncbi:WD40 domain containing protein [Pyrrhoderma noxium]|uniref:WD40 domain containing protein n=1 Tax=Pyrrhoderma noxium TaxID=2282107 RepID=A0A286UNH8_9AGAM|nr:WD40 domain containing protein [Pyrrhoderma noxium]